MISHPGPPPALAFSPAVGAAVAEPVAPIDTPVAPRDSRRIDRTLAALFADVRGRHGANPALADLIDRLGEFALRGGKRVRPRLCLASYRIAAGRDDKPPRAAWLVAASLEVFHAFMLIHDDLIDDSAVRRREPTLHERFRLEAGDAGPSARKRGVDLALVGGDLLFALGLRVLSRARLESAVQARVQRLVADMLLETGFGQALDVLYDDRPLEALDESHILEAYALKTSRYSIAGPLMLGSALAGSPPAAAKALGRYGDLLGMAYQIRNDLDGLEGDPDTDEISDLDGGKRTLVLWATHRRLDDDGREALAGALAAPVGPDRRRRLLALIRDSGAIDECRRRAETLLAEAGEALADSPIDPARQRHYWQLMGQFGLKGKASGHVHRA